MSQIDDMQEQLNTLTTDFNAFKAASVAIPDFNLLSPLQLTAEYALTYNSTDYKGNIQQLITYLSGTVVVKTTTYTAQDNEIILADASSGAFTITLPPAASANRVIVKKTDPTGNGVTIDGDSTETIDEQLTQLLTSQFDTMVMQSDGTNWQIINIMAFNDEFLLEVQKGNVAGHSIISKFGENPDIDSVFEYVWDGGGTYVAPTQARLHNIVSDDVDDAGTLVSNGTATGGSLTTLVDTGATFVTDTVAVGDYVLNDTNLTLGVVSEVTSETVLTIAGNMRNPNNGFDGAVNASGNTYRVVTNASTGASVFHVLGLDASLLEISEFVILNGTSIVATVNSYWRQYRARVFGSSTIGAEGTVTSTAQTDATVSCQIINGNNQTLMAIYTVPSDKQGYIFKWDAALSGKKDGFSVVHLRVGQLGGIGYITEPIALASSGNSAIGEELPWLPIPGGADIWIEADASVTDLAVSGGFDILLVEKT